MENTKPVPTYFYGKVSIVTLKFDDVQDHLLKQQRASKATLDKPSLRKKTLDIYTSRKDEFIKFAEDLGAKVVDAYNEMTTLLVYTASDQTREQLKQAPWFHSIAENTEMDLHLVQSRKLVNHHLLPSSLGLPDPSYQGKGTSVMILDSGVDYRRETFGKCSSAGPNCRVVFAKDFTAFDDGQRDNGNFHGTNVAAIAAGTRGVAPYAKIIAADVVKPNQRISPTDAIAAINWAIQNKEVYNIVALNMSFGGGRFYPAGCEVDSPYGAAIYEARRAGIIPVASAGNENNPNGMKSPACLPDVVSVGAVYDGGSVRPQTCPPPTANRRR